MITLATERRDFASFAFTVAQEAGVYLQTGYRTRPVAHAKGRSDLVTEFDRGSEDMLRARLKSLTPDIPFVGEEQDGRSPDDRRGLVWYVDPLDGTTNFVHGHPFWCVSVGLFDGDEPAAGAVVAPALGLWWVGWVGDAGEALRCGMPCAPSATDRIEDALVATGFPPVRNEAPANNFDSFMSVKRAARAVRRCGSAAMDLCMVADGTYDGYWERRLMIWDVAAASAIVLAAKGRITSLDGGKPDYHRGNIVASNGLVHDELMGAIDLTRASAD